MARIRRSLIALGAVALSALALAGCSNGNPLADDSGKASSSTITVGSANFPESEILAYIYADALEDNGVKTDVKPNIGARDRYLAALKNDEIQLVPEYTGNLLQFFDSKATAQSSDEVYTALKKAAPKGMTVLDQAPGQDADSYNVTKEFSDKYGVTSLADLKKVTEPLKVGANSEFGTRPYGIPGLEKVYGVKATLVPIADSGGPNTLKALLSNEVQLADIYSTTPSISQNNLVTLKDPEHLVVAQNVVPLIASDKASAKVKKVLDTVSAKLTTQQLIELNTKSSVDKESAQQIAKDWLSAQNLF